MEASLIRIDVDNYVLLYLQYEDHLHRYAVPKFWTVALAANHLIDTFDKEKPVHLRRRADTKYNVFTENGVLVPLITLVEVFDDDEGLVVKVEEKNDQQ